jgi:outer membrane protein OmpA-like peptidoglycan-associated protein
VEDTVRTYQTRRPGYRSARITVVVAVIAALYGPAVAPAAGQFGAIRDAARRAAEEKRKAEEEKRKQEEAKKQPPAAAPAVTPTQPSAAQPAPTAAATAPSGETTAASSAPSFQSYSKFDFVPGEKVVAVEDFTQDAIGDFPAKWNTNASGEIVTIAGQPGRWLKLTRAGFFTPEFVTDLPDNVTVEFDLATPPGFDVGFPLQTAFAELADVKRPVDWQTATNNFIVNAHPGPSQGVSEMITRQDGTSAAANSTTTAQLAAKGKPVHIAIWRQRQRVRVYMNEEKVWDIPRAAAATAKFNALVFFVPGGCGNCEYYLANVRVATGAPDTRNKILTEGKWVTHGILFDVNSDRIKPESYGTLKELAGVLSESADVKVMIVGHTDSDGDDAANMDLSKRRAGSVKAALVSEFKIDAVRLETDGKGESQPIDKNDNPAGKANNRRVEFIKK